MKKLYFSFFTAFLTLSGVAQITVVTAKVPQYIQGNSGTNNNRTPFWFWAELAGLTPGATYRFYPSVDTANASPTSNGAGNPYLINGVSKTFRRTINASLISSAGHDSLVADNTGGASGWFGLEPTGNGRFAPGTTVFPKLIFNDGAGGTVVSQRVTFNAYPVTVINYGTTSGNALQGTGIYDSAMVTIVPAKSFAALYDNTAYTGRPLALAVVESDTLNLKAVNSVVPFYRNLVDSMPQWWGTIIPNNNTNGVRGMFYYDFSGVALSVPQYSDFDGNWCSGAVTVSPSGGASQPIFLHSEFSLQGAATGPDTLQQGAGGTFTVTTNGGSPTFSWDFGDGSALGSGANPTHTYTATGTYTVNVSIQTPYCGLAVTHTVVVIPASTGIALNNSAAFSIMPNPSDGIFFINTKDASAKVLLVYNNMGQLVFETTLNGGTQVDLSKFGKGIYWLRLKDKAGVSAAQKVVLH